MRDYIVYYAGPAKTPNGYSSGIFNLNRFIWTYYSWKNGFISRFIYEKWRRFHFIG
tara:strand:+ start:151 stop:318 length:168 start_codon:yes stop_codon:yes gene_type:complete